MRYGSADSAGMATLLEKPASLLRDPDHPHLRGPTAGGSDLSEMFLFGEKAVREVVIDYQP